MKTKTARSTGRNPPSAADPLLLEIDYLVESPTTQHRDYALHDYEPRCDPRGLLHSGTILKYLLRQEQLSDEVWPIVDRLWKHLGPDQTVWGAKWSRGSFHSFEFYFYNWKILPRRNLRTLSSLRCALKPRLSHVPRVYENQDYEMCSFDIDAAFRTIGRVQSAHLYIPCKQELPNRDFLSYALEAEGVRFENHYSTFFTKKELGKVRDRLKLSIHAGNRSNLAILLPPQLTRCFRISYAIKPRCDGLYFNRISVNQATWFASTYLPGHLANVLKTNSRMFEHLYFDVGFDFTAPVGTNGPVELRKFAIYGLL